jgi:hypothetical protein
MKDVFTLGLIVYSWRTSLLSRISIENSVFYRELSSSSSVALQPRSGLGIPYGFRDSYSTMWVLPRIILKLNSLLSQINFSATSLWKFPTTRPKCDTQLLQYRPNIYSDITWCFTHLWRVTTLHLHLYRTLNKNCCSHSELNNIKTEQIENISRRAIK